MAKGLLKADVQLAEAYAAYCVSVLEANQGVNQLPTGKGVVSGSDTYILPAYWDASLMAYFSRVAILNKFTAPKLISGSNLYEAVWVAEMSRANDNGKGAATMFGAFPVYFDLYNIDTVNTPDLVTYLLSQNSVAMANRAYNPNFIETFGASKRWTMPSRFLPGFTYDVFNTVACSNDMVETQFKVKLLADLFVNPEGCTVNNTGILAFRCGSAT